MKANKAGLGYMVCTVNKSHIFEEILEIFKLNLSLLLYLKIRKISPRLTIKLKK